MVVSREAQHIQKQGCLGATTCSENPGPVFIMSAKRRRHAVRELKAWVGSHSEDMLGRIVEIGWVA